MQPSQLVSRDKIDAAYDDLHADLEFAYKRAKVLADMLGIPVQESPEVTGTILGLVRGSVERLIAERDLFKRETVALAKESLGATTEIMESTANMLRGMTLDPAIPQHAKSAMWGKISELEMAVELALQPSLTVRDAEAEIGNGGRVDDDDPSDISP